MKQQVVHLGPYKPHRQQLPQSGIDGNVGVKLNPKETTGQIQSFYKFGSRIQMAAHDPVIRKDKIIMNSDKYFKLKDVNMAPKQIAQAAKQRFEQRVEKKSLINQDSKQIEEASMEDKLILWSKYEKQYGNSIQDSDFQQSVGQHFQDPQVQMSQMNEDLFPTEMPRIEEEPPMARKKSSAIDEYMELKEQMKREQIIMEKQKAMVNELKDELQKPPSSAAPLPPLQKGQSRQSSRGALNSQKSAQRHSTKGERKDSLRKSQRESEKAFQNNALNVINLNSEKVPIVIHEGEQKAESRMSAAKSKNAGLPPISSKQNLTKSMRKTAGGRSKMEHHADEDSESNMFGGDFGDEDMFQSMKKNRRATREQKENENYFFEKFLQDDQSQRMGSNAKSAARPASGMSQKSRTSVRVQSAKGRTTPRGNTSRSRQQTAQQQSQMSARKSRVSSAKSRTATRREQNPYYQDDLTKLLEAAEKSANAPIADEGTSLELSKFQQSAIQYPNQNESAVGNELVPFPDQSFQTNLQSQKPPIETSPSVHQEQDMSPGQLSKIERQTEIYRRQFEQSHMDESLLEDLDKRAIEYPPQEDKFGGLYLTQLQDDDQKSFQLPEVDVGKFNEKIKHLEQMRKDAMRELINIEDEMGIQESSILDSADQEASQRSPGKPSERAKLTKPGTENNIVIKDENDAEIKFRRFTESQNQLIKQNFRTDLQKQVSSGILEHYSGKQKNVGQLLQSVQDDPQLLKKAQDITMYNALKSKCEENFNARQKENKEQMQAKNRDQLKQRQQVVQRALQEKSEQIKVQKINEIRQREIELKRIEEKKKKLQKQQIEKRKQEAIDRAKKVRDMIQENRMKVQLQSELLNKANTIDKSYKQELTHMTAMRNVNIADQVQKLHATHEMLGYQEANLAQAMLRDQQNFEHINTQELQLIQQETNKEHQQILLQDYYDRVLKGQYDGYAQAQNVVQARPLALESFDTGESKQESLRHLDDVQKQQMMELEYFNQQQAALQEKLRQQEELLALVQKDIETRENLVANVFQERNVEEQQQQEQPISPATQALPTIQEQTIENQPQTFTTQQQPLTAETEAPASLADLISNQLAGVDSYLELKKKQLEEEDKQ